MNTEEGKAQLRELYYNTKQEFISYLGGKCVRCGSTENLEFDHVDWRLKEFGIGTNWAMKDKAKLYAELDKCQLLCNSCHKEKTRVDQAEQKTKPVNHGTMYAWMKKKCRCDECNAARQIWYEKRNAKRRTADGPRGKYNEPAEHGTRLRYHRGCRCDACRAANTAHARELRQKKAEK